ncbi:hypothetical protein PVAP13_3NG315800 [Panicum virgatum]|uniref:Ubiquitin-like domain-containing protein n=1 Tax=Panicum virgatum TaxID=38727 RepID=A0A8T0UI00_PANVG|nr:hypothetical protein PVAP13_3NG315800 [Panicum virgatum]
MSFFTEKERETNVADTAKDLALLDGVGDFNQHNANSMKMFGMPSSSNSHLHCDISGHVRAGVVDAYDIQDPYSLVPELPALEHEPSNSSLSQFFIRSCNGIQLLNMDLRGATVETLKLVVAEREGIPVEEQYLILDGHKPLRDGTLLTDYDYVFGGQATIEVFPRIRGGNTMVEPLPIFVARHVQMLSRVFELSGDFRSWDGRRVQPVLTPLGVRILRGIMSCVLAAHQAGLAYNGSLQIGHLVVSGFSRGEHGLIVPETAAVRINDQMAVELEIRAVPLTPEGQKADYFALAAILGRVFRKGFPLHVDTIHVKLGNLAAPGGPAPAPATTQLLQAFVAMADPQVMATMWWNLARFANSLGPPLWHWNDGANIWEMRLTTKERLAFEQAVDNGSYWWTDTVTSNQQFSRHINGRNNYRYWAATDLLRFARNWFTHAPEAQGNDALRFGEQVAQLSSAAKLPDLDYYFSCGFHEFMAQVLENLYIREHSLGVRWDDLTRVLVPPS